MLLTPNSLEVQDLDPHLSTHRTWGLHCLPHCVEGLWNHLLDEDFSCTAPHLLSELHFLSPGDSVVTGGKLRTRPAPSFTHWNLNRTGHLGVTSCRGCVHISPAEQGQLVLPKAVQLQVGDKAPGRRKKTPWSSLPFSPLPSATAFLSGVLGVTDFFLAMLAPGVARLLRISR